MASLATDKDTTYTLATQHFMKETLVDARGKLYKLGVKTSYDDNRMIFTATQGSKAQLANIYTQECNGLILSTHDWKPLMVPPRSLRTNIITDISNVFLHQGLYHIYLASDGTCFNMYYYEDRWVISTAKGYDMNNVSWEDKTYQELITECLVTIGLTWETFTSKLNIKCCYSFGFKHKDFHRFYEGLDEYINRIWFIQLVNLDQDDKLYLWASDMSPVDQIKPQVMHAIPNNIKELYTIANNALSNFLSNKTACYGFILRSINYEATKSHSDLFIESSLMRNIRHIWYDNRLIKIANEGQYNKLQLTLVNAYLDRDLYEIFTLLFRQFIPELSSVSEKISLVVSEMIDRTNTDLTIATVANLLLDNFKAEKKYTIVNKTPEQKRRVFNEYVINKANLTIIMKLF
jgi:hypothetical protein